MSSPPLPLMTPDSVSAALLFNVTLPVPVSSMALSIVVAVAASTLSFVPAARLTPPVPRLASLSINR